MSTSSAFSTVGHRANVVSSGIEGRHRGVAFASRAPYYASEMASEVVDKVEEISPVESTSMKSEMISPASASVEATVPKKAAKSKKVEKKGPAHKEGVLTPVVLAAKKILGDDNLNKVRGKVISIHSEVIENFVKTSESEFGQNTLKRLFSMADKNGDGTIDEEELALAFKKLGFTWLQEKQVRGILKRADANGDGTICIDEFAAEAPKTLRTNLTKLAKKNGGEMGLLS